MPRVKTGKKNDIDVIIEIDLNEEKGQNSEQLSSSFIKRKKKTWRGRKKGEMQGVLDLIFYRESVFLLSRFLRDPTVGGLRDKKESCSTRRGLCVGTRFKEFRQNP